MRATPIPDHEKVAGHDRRVIEPQSDESMLDGRILPVEALVGLDDGVPVFRFRIVPEGDELDRLKAGEPFWLTLLDHVVPWSVGMFDPEHRVEREPVPDPDVVARLRAVMVDPTACAYCEGTGWVFNDKSYDGYPYGRGPYIEPDDTNGGYHACSRCNSDHEVEFGTGDKVKPWRRWTDDQVDEIARALAR